MGLNINFYYSPKLGLMARDYHAVSATGAGVEGHFSRSGRVMNPSRCSLHARTVPNIMIYTDQYKRLKKEIKRWKGAGMTIGDDVVPENSEGISGDQVPQDWRDQWWKECGHRFSSRGH
jgi:hAT family C-terminal dimerisation region